MEQDEIDLSTPQEPQQEEPNGFDQDMIQEYGLVPPKHEYEEYDQEQFQRGIQVEQEHTNQEGLAAVIAANHLDEIPDYYTRLFYMEKEAKEESGGEPPLESEPETPEEMGESNGFEKEKNRAQIERNRRKSMLSLRNITGAEFDKAMKMDAPTFTKYMQANPVNKK